MDVLSKLSSFVGGFFRRKRKREERDEVEEQFQGDSLDLDELLEQDVFEQKRSRRLSAAESQQILQEHMAFLHQQLHDKVRNLIKRAKYYKKIGSMDRSDIRLVKRIRRKGFATEFIPKVVSPSGQVYGYSIGLYYTFGFPDVLFVGGSLNKADFSVGFKSLVNTVNVEKEEIVEGKEYSNIIPGKSVRFKYVQSQEFLDYVGYAVYFYQNFYDLDNFPLLLAQVEKKETYSSPQNADATLTDFQEYKVQQTPYEQDPQSAEPPLKRQKCVVDCSPGKSVQHRLHSDSES